jgi:hypothetical protein
MCKCKYLRQRKRKNKYYGYCTIYRIEVPLFCKNCDVIEYKEKKPMKSRTNKQVKREKERFSIIYHDLTKCCVCGSTTGIEKNEIFEGAYRQTSIKHGMVAPMCYRETCHKRFHNDIIFNLFYKVMFQREFMKTHSRDEFIKLFGQDYIYKLEKMKKNY